MNGNDVVKYIVRLVVDELSTRTPAPAANDGDGWIAITKTPEVRATKRAVKAGELRAYRVGRALFVKRADLDAWLSAHPYVPPVPAAGDADPIARMALAGKLRKIEGGAR